MPDVYTISQMTAHLRQLIEGDAALRDTWVQGEVSNMKRAASGHWYFSLKDDRAQLRCVMWRSNASRQFVVPQDGDSIVVHGYVSVYDQRGDVQFYADFIRAAGVGDLYAQFEQLKHKLETEGFFDSAHKKPLPAFPLRIGLVTSEDAAALQDVLNVLERRFPLAEVILSPTRVQGTDAPRMIAAAITRLDQSQQADVILLVRGGGSMEDLWAFNDEQVARTIYRTVTPTVTGVGHETDFTIADFVADHRTPTPSAAAETVTPNLADIQAALDEQHTRLDNAILRQIDQLREQIRDTRRSINVVSPAAAIRNYRQQLDEIHSRLVAAQQRRLKLIRERLQAKQSALTAASPQSILQRGYAIVQRSEDGQIIRQMADAPPGTAIKLRLADGERKGRIEE